MAKPIEVTDTTFDDEVLKSGVPVLVDFWAVWCGPCRRVAPIVEAIAKEYEGRAKVCKVDVDNQQQTAIRFGIRSIPTLLIFKHGEVAEHVIGAVPKSELTSRLDGVLASVA